MSSCFCVLSSGMGSIDMCIIVYRGRWLQHIWRVASQKMSKVWRMPLNFCMKSQSMSVLVCGLVTASFTTTQLGASITVLVGRYVCRHLEKFCRKWAKMGLEKGWMFFSSMMIILLHCFVNLIWSEHLTCTSTGMLMLLY